MLNHIISKPATASTAPSTTNIFFLLLVLFILFSPLILFSAVIYLICVALDFFDACVKLGVKAEKLLYLLLAEL